MREKNNIYYRIYPSITISIHKFRATNAHFCDCECERKKKRGIKNEITDTLRITENHVIYIYINLYISSFQIILFRLQLGESDVKNCRLKEFIVGNNGELDVLYTGNNQFSNRDIA